ncbi:MAG: metal transporter [Proteobacteria bacterium]|nr:metal transporter [Pseudomonadota bacterium]
MNNTADLARKLFGFLTLYMERCTEMNLRMTGATAKTIEASQTYWNGVFKYFSDFADPYWISLNYFNTVERDKLTSVSPWENVRDYIELLQFTLQLAKEGLISSQRSMNNYHLRQSTEAFSAWLNTIFDLEGEDIEAFAARQAELMERVVYTYPEVIQNIKPEYGFHFDNGGYVKVAETDRFLLYQILPLDKKVKVKENGKPVIILPPYVLGANVLAFLPGENKSYVHCFANQGIPTYIRIMKDVSTTEAVQVLTGEDDARDTRFFCEEVKARHGKPVTLNGYCQGGFSAVCNILSGELDGLVDALITCVSPMDGTRSVGLADFLKNLPQRFNDLAYGTKTLPNGNKVADGKLMGWIYKLKSIDEEFPMVALYRDMMMLSPNGNKKAKISKTAAAINYWLSSDRTDLPMSITEMSFASYNIPITEDGTLPVKLFGRKLNLKRIKEKEIKWLICYGESDDLVEKETALAPLDYIDVEVAAFPKGHVAMATSWSNPESECALHTRFGDKNYRGPVRYQLDLEK